MHDNCNFYVKGGSICSKSNPSLMFDEYITIVVDLEAGTLLKIGKKDVVTDYFNNVKNVMKEKGFSEIVNSLQLITFHVKYKNLDIDEICTIINWFNNSIGDKMKWFLGLPLKQAKIELKRLQEIGF